MKKKFHASMKTYESHKNTLPKRYSDVDNLSTLLRNATVDKKHWSNFISYITNTGDGGFINKKPKWKNQTSRWRFCKSRCENVPFERRQNGVRFLSVFLCASHRGFSFSFSHFPLLLDFIFTIVSWFRRSCEFSPNFPRSTMHANVSKCISLCIFLTI